MTWGNAPIIGHGTVGPAHDGWMSQFLRADARRQVGMLERLHDRLEADLGKLAPDQLPGKEWVRVARLRLDGFRALAQLELETAKVRLLAERSHVKAPMSDEEFAAQIEALGRKAIGALSVQELEAEITRKRALPAARNPQHQDEPREQ